MSKLFVFEGMDGAGKTTLIRSVWAELTRQGFETMMVAEPTEITRNLCTRERLDPYTRFLLFLAGRNQQLKAVVEPALRDGKIVLCDRYLPSNYAYQGFGQGIPLETVTEWVDRVGYVEPAETFWLDVSLETAIDRLSKNGEELDVWETDHALLERVHAGYQQIYSDRIVPMRRLNAGNAPGYLLNQAMFLIKQSMRLECNYLVDPIS